MVLLAVGATIGGSRRWAKGRSPMPQSRPVRVTVCDSRGGGRCHRIPPCTDAESTDIARIPPAAAPMVGVGHTLLHLAAPEGHEAVTRLLIGKAPTSAASTKRASRNYIWR